MQSLAIQQTQQLALPSTVNANSSSAQVFANSLLTSYPMLVTVPASSVLNSREFDIYASGEVTTAGAYTVVITLLGKVAVPATPLTASNWTIIGASSAQSVSTTNADFLYRARLIVGATSGKLQGTFSCMINNVYDADAALTNVISSVAPTSTTVEPMLNFCVAVTFGTGSASNIGILRRFYCAA